MRCHICNSILSPPEIKRNKNHGDFDPCGKCLEVIGEVFNDDTEEEIDKQLDFEEGILDDELSTD